MPFSFTMHGPSIFYEPEKWRIDEKLRRARYVACISWFCRSQAAAWVEPEHWEKLKIVHCGVDVDELRPSHGSDGTQLLFVGRLTGFRAYPCCSARCRRSSSVVPAPVWYWWGDGPDREALEAQVRRLGLGDSVEFAGGRSPADVAALLAATDVFVLPSFGGCADGADGGARCRGTGRHRASPA
ncbi:MAG: glycosyltransferase [Ilumatobacteraceae bacterium]